MSVWDVGLDSKYTKGIDTSLRWMYAELDSVGTREAIL
jgi:hypothetical protein